MQITNRIIHIIVITLIGLLSVVSYADNAKQQDVSVVIRKGHPYDVTNRKTTRPVNNKPKQAVATDSLLAWEKNRADLTKVLVFALRNHPSALAADSRIRVAEHELRNTQSGFLPKLDAEYAYGPERSNNPTTRAAGDGRVKLMRQERKLRIQQLLYDGGKVWNRVKRDKAGVQATKLKARSTRESVGLRVVDAYLNVLRFRANLNIAAQDVRTHRDNLRKIELRLKGGAGRKSELALSRARISEAQARYELVQTRNQAANNVFIQQVGKAPPQYLAKSTVLPSQLPQGLTTAKVIALKNSPVIAAAQAEVTVAGNNVAAMRANYLPNVNLDLELSRNNELDGVRGANKEEMALVRVNYNLYNGGADHASVKKAIEERNEALQELAEVRRDVEERIATAWTDMKTNYLRYRELQNNVADAQVVVKSYQQEFSLGQRSLLNVLDAENEYFRARTNLVDANFVYLLSQYRVLEAMGMLTTTVLTG